MSHGPQQTYKKSSVYSCLTPTVTKYSPFFWIKSFLTNKLPITRTHPIGNSKQLPTKWGHICCNLNTAVTINPVCLQLCRSDRTIFISRQFGRVVCVRHAPLRAQPLFGVSNDVINWRLISRGGGAIWPQGVIPRRRVMGPRTCVPSQPAVSIHSKHSATSKQTPFSVELTFLSYTNCLDYHSD